MTIAIVRRYLCSRDRMRRSKAKTWQSSGVKSLHISLEPQPGKPGRNTGRIRMADVSAEQLRNLKKQGRAMTNASGDPSFPIKQRTGPDSLANAIRAVGRS